MRKRIGFVVLLVMLTGVVLVVPVAPVVQAYEGCGKALPSQLLADGWSFVSGHAPEVSPALGVAPLAKPAVTAGGAAAGGASIPVVAKAGVFLAGMEAGCRAGAALGLDDAVHGVVHGVMDWYSGDAQAVPTAPSSAITYGEPTHCSLLSYSGGYMTWPPGSGWNGSSSATTSLCRVVTIPGLASSIGGGSSFKNHSNRETVTLDDVTFGPYPASGAALGTADIGTPATTATVGTAYHLVTGANAGRYWRMVGDQTTSVAHDLDEQVIMYRGCDEVNVGGTCGAFPGESVGFEYGGSFVAFASMWPESFTTGQQRALVSDLRCTKADGSGTYWVRAVSPTFWDRQPDVRIPVPACTEGDWPNAFEISRPLTPITTTCPTLGACPERFLIFGGSSSTWATTGTTPLEVSDCFRVGTDCGVPQLQTVESIERCVWGVHELDSSKCLDAPVVDPAAENTELRPRTGKGVFVSPAPDPAVGPEAPIHSTLEPVVDGGDGGTTVDIEIPIDGGEGQGGGTLVGEDAECWPAGWGWFNPAQWVLRPIKCALVWAFVPTDAAGWASDQWDALETQVPFSYGVVLVDFLDVLSDPTTAAAAELCFGAIPMPEYDDGTNSYDAEEDEDACLDIAAQKAAAQENDALLTLLSWCTVGYVIYRMMIGTLGSVFK